MGAAFSFCGSGAIVMSLPAKHESMMSVEADVAAILGEEVTCVSHMHGGDLSAVYRVALNDGCVFVAKNTPYASVEAEMLRAIGATGAPAPAVIAVASEWLIMESMAAGGTLSQAWDDLAQVLNTLHVQHGQAYGWPQDYAFGAVDILNGEHADWPSFWAERRLLNHIPHMQPALARRIERLCAMLPDRLPQRPKPSLLHGDLWRGNILADSGRITGLIDPACYYGDREVDLAMLTLFDGPPARLFAALDLESGWQERQPIYRLWPWLVHLRLFGEGYRAAVETCLDELWV